LSRLSSFGAVDFLLSLILGAGTAAPAAWVNNAETDETRTAMV
jgi:hypothetical protein